MDGPSMTVGGPLAEKLDTWRALLADYEAKVYGPEGRVLMARDVILRMIEHGAEPVDELDQQGRGWWERYNIIAQIEVVNYSSCDAAVEAISVDVQAEVKLGRVLWVSAKPRIVHARGAVPKKDEAGNIRLGKHRLITDCSAPKEKNINSKSTPPRFRMDSVDDAVRMTKKGWWFCKIDLKAAYRHIRMNPRLWEFFGFMWGDEWYLDTYMCFGWNWAPWIFTLFGRAVVWLARRRGVRFLLVYIDDFLIIAESREEAQKAMDIVLELLAELGFTVEPLKCVPPTQVVIFLGVELDSVAGAARVPEVRLRKLKELLVQWGNKPSCTLLELQELVGLLNFVAKVVFGGRVYMRRLIAAASTAIKPWQHIKLYKGGLMKDIEWWRDFMEPFNGEALFIDPDPMPVLMLQTDASKTVGCGVFFDGTSISKTWAEVAWEEFDPTEEHINCLEVYPVWLACGEFPDRFANHHILFGIDNQTARGNINRGGAKSATVNGWLRDIFDMSARYNFRVSARYLPGRLNVLADALSRSNMGAYDRYLGQWRIWREGGIDALPESEEYDWLRESVEIMGASAQEEPLTGLEREIQALDIQLWELKCRT
eukprot:TRINITY_DN665_c0_g1_i1.p1 TRINITY_DN665_c0_g1~~TRINITY_DN665_c0_g1_i1.p1  ORF type:complete len:597 (+),score=85.38 TRINITY_DN665_c0_g1_i1:1929-3719(+)